MKAKRFIGATSRQVLQKVRLELGAEAVILSNKPCREGIEILAVSGSDMSRLIDEPLAAARGNAPRRAPAPSPARPRAAAAPSPTRTAALPLPAVAAYTSAARVAANTQAEQARHTSASIAAQAAAQGVTQAGAGSLMSEIRSMKGLLRQQMATLAWSDAVRRRPLRGLLMRELIAAGFSTALGRALVDKLPDDFSEAQAREWMGAVLERNLRCNVDDEVVGRGGVYALVGPTGVGKTTTAAKLAARCVMMHGAQQLGLITTDSYRVGAEDQLRTYGKILGAPVFVAQDAIDLRHALGALAGKRLVLIDTVGMAQRNAQVAEQHDMLANAGVRRLLLLNAASQSETLDEVVSAYQGRSGLAGAVVTKLDEAARPGCALDVVIRRGLGLRYVTTGQRVPEDLHLPNPRVLVHRALKSAVKSATRLSAEELGLLFGPTAEAGAAAHA
ncbi:MAG: flagellar biosynthesis protein FlhF [Betaproteobacteria bacterium]|nr:flagellar biosynthesis protein FlhF [Betaproteobacteria bacterium]